MSSVPAAKRLSLTDMAIRAAKPAAKPYVLYDTKQRHLALMVHPGGAKSYKVRYSRHGRARWFSLGTTSELGLADARRLAAGVMLEVISGKDPHTDRQARRGDGTFAELVEAYERGTRSMRQYESQLRKWALPRWGRLPASEISRSDGE